MFLLPALESSTFIGVVVPGEIAVLIGGVAAHGGALPLWAVILAAVAGAVTGDQVGYLLGRHFGPRLLERLPARLRRSGNLDRARDLLRRRGAPAVAAARWAAVLRAFVPGLAGMSGMARARFTVANVVGGALWATTIAVPAARSSSASSCWSASSCGGVRGAGADASSRDQPPAAGAPIRSSSQSNMRCSVSSRAMGWQW